MGFGGKSKPDGCPSVSNKQETQTDIRSVNSNPGFKPSELFQDQLLLFQSSVTIYF